MTAFTYTAERELAPGHAQGTDYTIDIACRIRDIAKDVRKSEQRSLGTVSETLLWRNNKRWQIETQAYNVGNGIDQVLEFVESVIGGETFQFDEFGSANAPGELVNVVMEGTYTVKRVARQGDGGRLDYFRYAFRIRQA